MPGYARKDIVREGEVGTYHCWSRCVQRSFLCGHDPETGCDFNYPFGFSRRSPLHDCEVTTASEVSSWVRWRCRNTELVLVGVLHKEMVLIGDSLGMPAPQSQPNGIRDHLLV